MLSLFCLPAAPLAPSRLLAFPHLSCSSIWRRRGNELRKQIEGVGQVRVLVLATRSLHRAYRRQVEIQNILLSKEPLQERIENDLLLLGGLQNNEVTAKFLELLSNEPPARMVGRMIIWRMDYRGDQWLDQGHLNMRDMPSIVML